MRQKIGKENQFSSQLNKNLKIQQSKSKESIDEAFRKSMLPLLEILIDPQFDLNKLFLKTKININKNRVHINQIKESSELFLYYSLSFINDDEVKDLAIINFDYLLIDFNNNGTKSFSVYHNIDLHLHPYSYSIELVTNYTEGKLLKLLKNFIMKN